MIAIHERLCLGEIPRPLFDVCVSYSNRVMEPILSDYVKTLKVSREEGRQSLGWLVFVTKETDVCLDTEDQRVMFNQVEGGTWEAVFEVGGAKLFLVLIDNDKAMSYLVPDELFSVEELVFLDKQSELPAWL